MRHSAISLTQSIDRLQECFRRIRDRRWWREHVVGGVATIEFKLSSKGAWHVHLHALVEGSYLPKRELSGEWLAVTGDSPIVDVRKVDENARAIAYVAKYVGKPLDSTVLQSEERTDELVDALRGRRALLRFGQWHASDEEEEDEDPNAWVTIGPLDYIYEMAKRNCKDSRRIIEALKPGLCLRQMWDYDHTPRRSADPPSKPRKRGK